tara:strand:- start:259 stop:1185 length:927 start_codon:yes stop_codon:yes gene_type:complete
MSEFTLVSKINELFVILKSIKEDFIDIKNTYYNFKPSNNFETINNIYDDDNTCNQKKTFLSFGNQRFQQSRKRILEEAQQLKLDNTNQTVFNNFIIETENIEKEEGFQKMTKQIPQQWGSGRGYYWYMWKPYIVYKNLKKLKDGEILFYCDSGMKIPNTKLTKDRFNDMFKLVSNKKECPTGIATFITTGPSKDRFEYMYNTVYVFEFFKVLNNQDITHTQQCQAGVSMFYKCEESMRIVEQWYNLTVSNPELFVGDLRIFPNTKRNQMPGFRDHRQDQSIWSVIVKLNNVNILKHDKNPMHQTHYRI